MTRIVAIGECMVEMAPTAGAGTYQMGFAGDTMNTAWYLRGLLTLSDQVDFLSAVGTDAISDRMIGFLQNAGIGVDHIARRPDRTIGLYMIQLQNGERSFNYWRGQSAARRLAQDRNALTHALIGADIAYFSGITLAILPPSERANLLEALRDFRVTGGSVMFDPNLRPHLWETPDEMTQAVSEAAKVCDVVLPSFEDEAAWFSDADPVATAHRYAQRGAGTVVVKNGAGRILVLHDSGITEFDPVVVNNVLDSTAAGDSFNAGFLASRIAGQTVAQSVHAASALASKVIQHRGALVTDL